MSTKPYYTTYTNAGLAREAAAHLSGGAFEFATLAVGDGDIGTISEARARSALVNEVWRGAVKRVWKDPDDAAQVIVETIIPASVAPIWIKEMLLVASDGTPMVIGKCIPIYKPSSDDGQIRTQVIRMVIKPLHADTVTLYINADIITAADVTEAIISQGADLFDELGAADSVYKEILGDVDQSANTLKKIYSMISEIRAQKIHPGFGVFSRNEINMDSLIGTINPSGGTESTPTITMTKIEPGKTAASIKADQYLISSLTWEVSGSSHLATALCYIPHGLSTGDTVIITGATSPEYNKTWTITVVDPVRFTFTIGALEYPERPSTGSVTWRHPSYFYPCTDDVFMFDIPRNALSFRDVTWLNGHPAVYGPNQPYSFEFVCNDDACELVFLSANIRISIDGLRVTTGMTKYSINTASYPADFIKLTFPSSRARVIKIETMNPSSFVGVWTKSSKSLAPVIRNRKPRCLMLADSFGEGTGAIDRLNSVTHYIGMKMGWDMINASLGSTGITTGGLYGRKYQARLCESTYLLQDPDIVLVWGSVNDGSNVTAAAAGELFDAIANIYPRAQILAFGPTWPSEPNYDPPKISAAGIIAAAKERRIPYLDGGLGVTGKPTWITTANKQTYYNGTAATATAAVSSGEVSSATVVSGGDGYDPHGSAPVVTISGDGTGAAASAVMNFRVTDIQLLNGGFGYTSAPTVTVSNGATAVSRLSGSSVGSILVTSQGENYTGTPTVTISGDGSGATATAVIEGGRVVAIKVTAGGSGYTTAPAVTISSSSSSATATATISNGKVTGVQIVSKGGGYTSCPVVTISGGGGAGARAVAFISGEVSAISVTSGGSGYTAATVSVAHPSGGDTTHPKTNGHQMLAVRICNEISNIPH